jgi:hypothetical protein
MLIGPLTFVSKSFNYSAFIKHKTEAIALSQEGLEFATSLRNGVSNIADFVNIVNNCSAGCSSDWNGINNVPDFQACSGENCKMSYNSSDPYQKFRHVGDKNTDYFRTVKFIKNQGSSYNVESRVWREDDGEIKVDLVLNKTIFVYGVEY